MNRDWADKIWLPHKRKSAKMRIIPVFIVTILIWTINPYHYKAAVRVGNAAFDSCKYAKRRIVCQERRIHYITDLQQIGADFEIEHFETGSLHENIKEKMDKNKKVATQFEKLISQCRL